MATGPTPKLLGLPPELRTLIFTYYFRSVRIRKNRKNPYESDEAYEARNDQLAILLVCRQIYYEAEPLALPNVQLFCSSNALVIATLTKMSAAQISQLQHMVVHHCPVGFDLSSKGHGSKEETTSVSSDADNDHRYYNPDYYEDWEDDNTDDHTIYFHLGAILGLFPGLQLDILEVFSGVSGGPYTGYQTTDCFGSLLEADGYRQLWMRATEGDGSAWMSTPSSLEWKHYMATRFKPYNGWVQFRLPRYEWNNASRAIPQAAIPRGRYIRPSHFWRKVLAAGITLVKKSDFPDDPDEDYETDDDEYEDGQSTSGHGSEDVADIVVDRGDADFAVKDDDRVLRCIERDDARMERPEFFKSTSDALRKFFKENNWEAIQAMDGFDDGTVNSWDQGDYCYSRRH